MNGSIRQKLLLGLIPLALFFVLQGALVWYMGSKTTTAVGAVVKQNTLASSQLGELAVLAQQVRRYEKEYFVYVNNVDRRNGYIKEWTGTSEKIDKLLAGMSANVEEAFLPADKVEIAKWQGAAGFYSAEMRKIFSAVDTRDKDIELQKAANAAIATPAPKGAPPAPAVTPTMAYTSVEVNAMIGPGKDRLSGELIKGVATMGKVKTEQTLALPAIAQEGFGQLLYAALGTVLLGLIVVGLVILTLPKAIQKPIEALTQVIDAISKGQVDKAAPSVGVAEFVSLEKGLERLRQSQKILMERMARRASA